MTPTTKRRGVRRTAGALLAARIGVLPLLPTGLGAQEAAVAAVIEAVFAASEARDYAALDTLYAEDATIVEAAGIDRGWAAYRDQHLKPGLAQFENFTYRPRNIDPHVGEDWAWALFEYNLKLQVEGRNMNRMGRGTVVLQRRDDGWVARHMQTANRPPKE